MSEENLTPAESRDKVREISPTDLVDGRPCWFRFAVNESPDPWTEGVVVFDPTSIAGGYGISYDGEFGRVTLDEVRSRVGRGVLVVTYDDPEFVTMLEEEAEIEASTRPLFWPVEAGYGVTIDASGRALCDVCAETCENAGEDEALFHVEAHRRHDPDGGPDVGFAGYGWAEASPAPPVEGSIEWEQEAVDLALERLSEAREVLVRAERAFEDAKREERDAAAHAGVEVGGSWARVSCPTCGAAIFEASTDGGEGLVFPGSREMGRRRSAGEFVAKYGFVSDCSECA